MSNDFIKKKRIINVLHFFEGLKLFAKKKKVNVGKTRVDENVDFLRKINSLHAKNRKSALEFTTFAFQKMISLIKNEKQFADTLFH